MSLLTCASNLFFKFLHFINYLQYANHNDQGFIDIFKDFWSVWTRPNNKELKKCWRLHIQKCIEVKANSSHVFIVHAQKSWAYGFVNMVI